jgi:hypothetical protein
MTTITRRSASPNIARHRIRERDGARRDFQVELLDGETFADTLKPEFFGAKADVFQPGDRIAIGVIVAANVLDHVRARLRAHVPRKLWGTEMPARVALLDRWATPAWLAVHACLIWSTLIGRSITWGGRTYWIDAQQRLERMEPS